MKTSKLGILTVLNRDTNKLSKYHCLIVYITCLCLHLYQSQSLKVRF